MAQKNSAGIQSIDKSSVHKICSGQVILDLATAVKELVENSVDAGALSVEIKLKEYGLDIVEVIDNGSGVSRDDHEKLALKHYTSKISKFEDIYHAKSYGFRGEALSSLCAFSQLTVITCTQDEAPIGTKLEYDNSGKLLRSAPSPRTRGTTVTLSKLFHSLPVRLHEFKRNIKREFAKCVDLLQAYAMICTGVRISMTNQIGKGDRTRLFATHGNPTLRDNIANVFGTKVRDQLVEFKLDLSRPDSSIDPENSSDHAHDKMLISGFISLPNSSASRNSSDRVFLYLNKRPCTAPKITKAINEAYSSCITNKYPIAIVDLTLPNGTYDINITPDKRTVLLQDEQYLKETIKDKLSEFLQSLQGTFATQKPSDTAFKDLSNMSLRRSFLISPDMPQISPMDGTEVDVIDSDDEPAVTPIAPSQQIVFFSDTLSTRSPNLIGSAVSAGVRTSYAPQNLLSAASAAYKNLSQQVLSFAPQLSSSSNVNVGDGEAGYEASPTDEDDFDIPDEELQKATQQTPPSGLSATFKSPADTPATNKRPHSAISSREATTSPSSQRKRPSTRKSKAPPPALTRYLNDIRHDVQVDYDFSEISRISALKVGSQKSKPHVECVPVTVDEETAVKELRRLIRKDNFREMQVLGQFNLGFIVVRLKNDLFIIDQHASDEKFNFENLKRTMRIATQRLLQPIPLDLTAQQELLAVEHEEILKNNGFQISVNPDNPPSKRVLLIGLPESKGVSFSAKDFEELLCKLNDGADQDVRCSRVNTIMASKACRTAVMIGDALDMNQMRKIVFQMGTMDQPWNCPHGRPTMRHLADLSAIANEYSQVENGTNSQQ